MDQLLHTPSKIFMLSLLMNSTTHRDSLMKVLEQTLVYHDVTIDQFIGVVGNITACNNLSFCDEKLHEEGINHNFALHICLNYQEDSLSSVLIYTCSLLNVIPKSTLAKLAY